MEGDAAAAAEEVSDPRVLVPYLVERILDSLVILVLFALFLPPKTNKKILRR